MKLITDTVRLSPTLIDLDRTTLKRFLTEFDLVLTNCRGCDLKVIAYYSKENHYIKKFKLTNELAV